MPRVLLLHASVGTGHRTAARALGKAFELRQSDHVRVEDVLDHTSRLFRIAYARSYLELTDHAPLVWGYFYSTAGDDDELGEITNNIRKLVESIGTVDLKALLRRFLPDVIVCTHFLPMELLVSLKKKARLPQPVYCVITDHAAHTFWTYTMIEGYFVGSDTVRRQLVERGVPPQHIHVTGIPVDPSFAEPRHRDEERARLNLPLDKPVITLMGGGVPNASIRTIARTLLARDIEGVLVIAAGRNETLLSELADLQPGHTLDMRLLGYIDYMDSLITASDLVVTKAGGLITSEVLARGVPLVVIDPILGQEEWNADFVVNSGAGVQLRMAASVPDAVCRLICAPHLLTQMREAAARAGRPRAAMAIADYIISDYNRIHGPQVVPDA